MTPTDPEPADTDPVAVVEPQPRISARRPCATQQLGKRHAGCSGLTTGSVITSGGGGNPWCAVTYDEHIGRWTPSILDAFADAKMLGTFFCVGKEANDHRALTRMILDGGHEVGNHSWSHVDLTTLSDKGAIQLALTQNALAKAYGYKPCTFRPPFGSVDAGVTSAAAARGLATIKWSKAANIFDTNPASVSADVVAAAVAGSIIVLHQIPAHAAALPSILAGLRGKGLTSVPVVKLLGGAFT